MKLKYGKRGRPTKKLQATKKAAEGILKTYEKEHKTLNPLFSSQFRYLPWK